MSTKEEDRIRKIEDTLLLIPTEFDKITSTQVEIVEHLEQINGSFGEFDERIHSVETKWNYKEKRDEEKTASKGQMYILAGIIIAAIIAVQGIVIFFA